MNSTLPQCLQRQHTQLGHSCLVDLLWWTLFTTTLTTEIGEVQQEHLPLHRETSLSVVVKSRVSLNFQATESLQAARADLCPMPELASQRSIGEMPQMLLET